MKVTLAEHGGPAAFARLPHTVDSRALPQPDARELEGLVAAARNGDAVLLGSGQALDGNAYTITVEDGDNSAVLRQSDSRMSVPFAALREWLLRRS